MLDMANHPAPPLAVSESEAEALRAMTRAGTTEQRTALRAKVILRAAEGVANVAIADELGISVPTVGLWRTRFKQRGLAGLADGRGRAGRRPMAGRSANGSWPRP
jgi:FixJ family two-component response regulator